MRSFTAPQPHACLILAIFAVAVTSGSLAQAQDHSPAPSTSPVTVEGCTITAGAALDNPKIGYRPAHVSGVTITYTLSGTVAAGEIDFRVNYQGTTGKLVDRGSLAPGVKIRREFSSFDPVYSGGNTAECSATSVVFSDGTRWDTPASPAPGH